MYLETRVSIVKGTLKIHIENKTKISVWILSLNYLLN